MNTEDKKCKCQCPLPEDQKCNPCPGHKPPLPPSDGTPRSLREKYMKERLELYKVLDKLNEAILALSSGNVASYSLGNRSVSYQSIDQIKALRKEAEDRIDELEAYLRGASVRNVTVSTFLDPSLILPPRW